MELIDRGKLERVLQNIADHLEAMETIHDQPTVDAEPVVRCKDCKHYEKYRPENDWGDCTLECDWRKVHDSDFCSFGEQREETGKE